MRIPYNFWKASFIGLSSNWKKNCRSNSTRTVTWIYSNSFNWSVIKWQWWWWHATGLKSLNFNIRQKWFLGEVNHNILTITTSADHQKYTKDDIMKTFNCSRYIVDKARKLQSECVGLVIPEKTKQWKINCLPNAKVEHFLDFLFSSNLMQDVAYGVNKINFDSGDEQKVANSILTMKYSYTTAYYRQFFSDTSFEPISESTLWKKTVRNKSITKKKPSWLRWYNCSWDEWILHTQHSTAESVKRMDLAKNMETGKPSLKAKFLNKCNASSTLPTHSTSFGLSDVSDLALQEPHCA